MAIALKNNPNCNNSRELMVYFLQGQVLGMWLVVVVVVVVDSHRHSSPTATPSICKMVSADKQEPRDLCLFCVEF